MMREQEGKKKTVLKFSSQDLKLTRKMFDVKKQEKFLVKRDTTKIPISSNDQQVSAAAGTRQLEISR